MPMSLYKNNADRIADVLAANASTAIRFKPAKNGKMMLAATNKFERVVLKEEQAAAIARLTIDKAMQDSPTPRGER